MVSSRKLIHDRNRGENVSGEFMRAGLILLFASIVIAGPAQAQTPAPEGAKVYFISPENGSTVTSPVLVRFGLSGMGIAPAGVEKPNTGHHHLLIDTDVPDLAEAIPMDATHMHFGGGQTEALVTLTPGTHTLQLLLGDWSHIPHKPPIMSDKITVTVK
jgi:hypothetical protein